MQGLGSFDRGMHKSNTNVELFYLRDILIYKCIQKHLNYYLHRQLTALFRNCEYECNENKLGYKVTKIITDDTMLLLLRKVLAMTFCAFKIIREQITTEKRHEEQLVYKYRRARVGELGFQIERHLWIYASHIIRKLV